MKQYDVRQCRIVNKETLAQGIYSVWVEAGELAAAARPGQFAQIYAPGKTLRRPISICEIQGDRLRFVFQVRGEGTALLAQAGEGECWDILAPLGHGFDLGSLDRRVCFVGGGIGVPPLVEAAKAFGANAVAVTGFRSRDAVILQEDFRKNGNEVILVTDDGSAGLQGLVTEHLPQDCQALFACGPTPMLRAVAAEAQRRGIPCQLSLEQRMACGVGACLGCAVKLNTGDGGWRYGHVCKDGPVFQAGQVAFD
ncbi:MAG TPA: dihydroorotate dehydrogenase electron transfer subunit [Candidatus Caccousia avistercoris]|nr:dihydroorotate dehydrogenase electron transfer subunit [Candidatus Caccousia avistercoris]